MAIQRPADIPPELDKYGRLGQLIKQLWNEVRKAVGGDPAKHGHTHRVGGSDPLQRPLAPPPFVKVGGTRISSDIGTGPSFMRENAQSRVETGAPSGMANANAEGSSDKAPRLDHRHKRDVRVYADRNEVATRNAIEFSGLTVTDDPARDRVRVSPRQEQEDLATRAAFDSLALRDLIYRNY